MLETAEVISGYMFEMFQYQLAITTKLNSPETQDFEVPGQPTAPAGIRPEFISESEDIVNKLVNAYCNSCEFLT